jgi:prenylcysteine alpha-carboxyl methylesterase
MSKGLLKAIFGEGSTPNKPATFSEYSPYHYFNQKFPTRQLPRTLLLHGTNDATVPHSESESFMRVLQQHGVEAHCKLYQGGTHTSKLLEDPFRGGKDDIVADVLHFMAMDNPKAANFWPMLPFPRILAALAGIVCPF